MKYFQQDLKDPVQFLSEGYNIRQHSDGEAGNLFAALSQPQLLIRQPFIDMPILQRKASLVAVIASCAGVDHLKKCSIANINIRAASEEEWWQPEASFSMGRLGFYV